MPVSSDDAQVAGVEHLEELDDVVEGVTRIRLGGAPVPQSFEDNEGISGALGFRVCTDVLGQRELVE